MRNEHLIRISSGNLHENSHHFLPVIGYGHPRARLSSVSSSQNKCYHQIRKNKLTHTNTVMLMLK